MLNKIILSMFALLLVFSICLPIKIFANVQEKVENVELVSVSITEIGVENIEKAIQAVNMKYALEKQDETQNMYFNIVTDEKNEIVLIGGIVSNHFVIYEEGWSKLKLRYQGLLMRKFIYNLKSNSNVSSEKLTNFALAISEQNESVGAIILPYIMESNRPNDPPPTLLTLIRGFFTHIFYNIVNFFLNIQLKFI